MGFCNRIGASEWEEERDCGDAEQALATRHSEVL